MSSEADIPKKTLIETLEDMGEAASEEGLSLGGIRDQLDQSAFGALLIALAMPVSIPLLYGVPQVVAVPMLFLAAQMVIGRKEPWLPAKLANRMISKSGLQQMARGARKWFGWVERLAYPRLTFLASRPAERIIGLFLCVFCTSILIPLPATNTVPGIAVAIVGFGLLAKDGLLILPGLALGSAWVTGLVLVGDRITDIIRNTISGIL
ncbi:MAG: exopolysaccharide biosynthesis protein [Pseudomonadota bacterium]